MAAKKTPSKNVADAAAPAGAEQAQPELLRIADRVRAQLGDGGAVVLGSPLEGNAALAANFGAAPIERGLSAAEVVREAARC